MKKMTKNQLLNLKQNKGKSPDEIDGYPDSPPKIRTKPKRNLTSKQLLNLKQNRDKSFEDIVGHPPKTEEEKKQYLEDYRKINVNKIRNYSYKRNYNIGIDDWNNLFDLQSGKCAICGKHQSEFKRKLDTDHDHTTGRIRGLLCHSCNLKIGYYETSNIWFNNNKDVLEKYLNRQSKYIDFSI